MTTPAQPVEAADTVGADDVIETLYRPELFLVMLTRHGVSPSLFLSAPVPVPAPAPAPVPVPVSVCVSVCLSLLVSSSITHTGIPAAM